MSDKVIITAALSGNGTYKNSNEAVPYTVEETAEEAFRCFNAGASIVHVHARDENKKGIPTDDVEKFSKTIQAIRSKCPGLIINMTTSAANADAQPKDRILPIVTVKPELASLNTNSMNFALADHKNGKIIVEMVFQNAFGVIVDFATQMKANGVKPESEVYDLGGMYNMVLLRKQEGLFQEPMHFQFVFGVVGGIPFDIGNLKRLLDIMPQGATWSVCGVGPHQIQTIPVAAAIGGHLRVGLEDNIRGVNGQLSKGSYEQVEWAANIARLVGRDVASPEEARKILNL